MGVVYRATDTDLRPPRRGEGAAQRRPPAAFADEARITGQLQHPAIPPVHDLGTLPDGRRSWR